MLSSLCRPCPVLSPNGYRLMQHQGDAGKTVRMLEDTLVAQDNEEGLRRQLADAVEAVQAMEATKATAVVRYGLPVDYPYRFDLLAWPTPP